MRSFLTSIFVHSFVLLTIATALPYPFVVSRDDYTNINISLVDVIRNLGPQLSSNASIYASGDPRFANATARYSEFRAPNFTVVVEPGIEADVAKIVKYANSINLPFMAVNKGHGTTETQGHMQHGLEIHIRALNRFEVAADGKSVYVQGGVYGDQINGPLWDAGYVTTTGSCGCVGLLGPGLGGGFGRWAGFYGLVSDSFIELNVVLASGTAITVSEAATPDLWWAMRGAGHNFGVVTSFRKEIHPRPVESWYYVNYIFMQDKLEQLFEVVNKQINNGTQPKELITGLIYLWDPAISTTEPVIFVTFQYAGSAAQAAPFVAPFNAIASVSKTEGSVPYPGLGDAVGTSSSSPLCVKGSSHVQYALGLLTYNVTTQRQVYDYFKQKTLASPEYQAASVVLENYALGGVKAIDPASSAYPHREDNILVALNVGYTPNISLDDGAIAFARNMRAIWQLGQPGRRETAYVNYAFGDEPMEQIYGYEAWRLEKLRTAKAKYDPSNKFGYYNPITGY